MFERTGRGVTPTANLLRREADIAVRMVRPAQSSLIARKLADLPIVAAAHRDYLALPATQFALRTDDQAAYGRLVAAGAGIGFVAKYNIPHWPGVVALPAALAPA